MIIKCYQSSARENSNPYCFRKMSLEASKSTEFSSNGMFAVFEDSVTVNSSKLEASVDLRISVNFPSMYISKPQIKVSSPQVMFVAMSLQFALERLFVAALLLKLSKIFVLILKNPD